MWQDGGFKNSCSHQSLQVWLGGKLNVWLWVVIDVVQELQPASPCFTEASGNTKQWEKLAEREKIWVSSGSSKPFGSYFLKVTTCWTVMTPILKLTGNWVERHWQGVILGDIPVPFLRVLAQSLLTCPETETHTTWLSSSGASLFPTTQSSAGFCLNLPRCNLRTLFLSYPQ